MSTATSSASIKTGEISGRRKVRYDDFDQVVADAERLSGGYRQLGNWSLGMICKHIAIALGTGLDGSSLNVAFPIRFVARMLYKNKALKAMKPGFQLPKNAAAVLVPPQTSDAEGIEALRVAARRWKSESQRHPHAFFGRLTSDEWNRLMLRHAEMHMSFLLPP